MRNELLLYAADLQVAQNQCAIRIVKKFKRISSGKATVLIKKNQGSQLNYICGSPSI